MVRVIKTADLRFDYGGDIYADGWTYEKEEREIATAVEAEPSPGVNGSNRIPSARSLYRPHSKPKRKKPGKPIAPPPKPPEALNVGQDSIQARFAWE